MVKLKDFIVILIASSFLLGCATIFKGGHQTISFSSNPDSAKVYLNGENMGKTPFELQLKVNKSYNVEFRKEGYSNRTLILSNSVGAGWIILDVVLGGIIGIAIDAATGDWYSLDQDHLNAPLEATKTEFKTTNQDEGNSTIETKNNGSNISKKLKDLKGLLDEGIITKDEFEARRKKILDDYTGK